LSSAGRTKHSLCQAPFPVASRDCWSRGFAMSLEALRASDGAYNQDGPTIYQVVQSILFLKPHEEPTSTKIVKVKKSCGYKVYSTGYTWRGPQGGLWAEVDPTRNQGTVGWMLVEGPGFGVKGPLLMDEATDNSLVTTVKILINTEDALFSATVPRYVTVGTLIEMLCSRTGLENKEVVLTKALPAKNPDGSGRMLPLDYTHPKDVLRREWTLGEADVQDKIYLIYMDELPQDVIDLATNAATKPSSALPRSRKGKN